MRVTLNTTCNLINKEDNFMKNKFLLSLCLFSFFIVDTVHAFEIDRRREQFNKQYGQFFVPLPYSLPGLGTGLLFIGNFGNILDTTTDIAAIGGIGDAEFISYGCDLSYDYVKINADYRS